MTSKEQITLEICAFSIDALYNAENAGAHRVELCDNPKEGGTTPSIGLIKQACCSSKIDIFPIIRPRGGDFNFSNEEFNQMKFDITEAKKAGCHGIATAIVNAENRIDKTRLKELVDIAYPLEVTFIRAFDIIYDPFEALEDIIDSGCKRLLTSGMATTALEGAETLKKLITQANNRISIMPGSGINSKNIESLIKTTGAKEYHASARSMVPNTIAKADSFGFGNKTSNSKEEIKQILNKIKNRCKTA
ncbi:copper homeostasis protein CutC [Marinilabiliaceae bacterium ANBcel2]|nr:copper homeostasis protein CutC [Marinilabiliaceae bacterium ANBcel2]